MKPFRYEYEKEIIDYLLQTSHVYEILCDRGLTGLKKVIESNYITEENNAIIFMFRNSLAYIDSIPTLIKNPSVESIKLVARSIFEIKCYIEYIFKENTNNRAIAYQVFYLKDIIKFYQKLDSDTDQGKEFSRKWAKDSTFSLREYKSYDTKSYIKRLEEQLCRSPYKEINEKMDALKGKYDWYTFDIGKNNFYELCEYLSCQITYDYFYRQWSGMIHGKLAYQGSIYKKEGGGIEAIRSLYDFKSLTIVLVPIIISLYSIIFKEIVPEYYYRIMRYYKNQLKPEIEKLNNINIVGVD
jgi:hypothetical protein